MRLVVIMLVGCGIFLSGCVTYHHPTATVAQQQQDEVECTALAEQGAGPSDLWFRQSRRAQLLKTCLESRGWQVPAGR
jgi:hypothetical protein